MKGKPEIIYIDCTDEDEENMPPNLQPTTPAALPGAAADNVKDSVVPEAVVKTAEASKPETPPAEPSKPDTPPTGASKPETPPAESSKPDAPSTGASKPETPPTGASKPDAPPAEASKAATPPETSSELDDDAISDPPAPLGIPFSTSFSFPKSRRGSGRLTQLQLPLRSVAKKRRPDTSRASEGRGVRQTRLATMQVRPLFRNERMFVERTLTRPPPLRISRTTTPMTLHPHTHHTSGGVETLLPAAWPDELVPLGNHYNPHAIRFQDLPTETMCRCEHPCRVNTCTNANSYIYCDVYCCPFAGLCGNGLEPSRCLGLMQNQTTSEYTVACTDAIDAHVTIGEYLGKMKLESFSEAERPKNSGYRFYMHHDPDHAAGARVCIDAVKYANLMRFVNHSCFPNARFRQVHNGAQHTVVIVTNRRLERGEEILVDYGSNLWFLCKCGGRACRHIGVVDDCNDADDEMGNDEKAALVSKANADDSNSDDSDDFE